MLLMQKRQRVLQRLMLPPPTNRDWVQKAVAIVSKLSGIAVVERVDAVKQVPCREIAPHIRDEIVGIGPAFEVNFKSHYWY